MQRILNFKPARFYDGVEPRIEYYYEIGDRYVRKKIKVKHISDIRERRRYALSLCAEINDKFYSGWNPAIEGDIGDSLRKAISFYLGNFLPPRPDSVRTYNSVCKTFLEWAEKRKIDLHPATSFNKKRALEFLAAINSGKKLSARTYNNYVGLLRTVFNKLKEHQFVNENPFEGIGKKRSQDKHRKVIPMDVLKKIRSWCNEHQPEMILPMKLLYYCGIRPTEICRLRVHNIQLDRGLIVIDADQAKDHESAPISLPVHLIQDLAMHIRSARSNDYLISGSLLNPGNRPTDGRALSKKWDRMRRNLGLEDIYQLYSLKDTGALAIARNIDSPIELKDQFRHSSLDTTSMYIRKAKPVANQNIARMKEDW